MTIHIPNKTDSGWHIIFIDGKLINLRPKSFRYFFIMAAQRLIDDGWVDQDELEVSLNVPKHVYRLRKELRDQGVPNIIESGRYKYRLCDAEITIEAEKFEDYADFDIRYLAGKL